ncbi:MAG: tRNA cyclic N6-threonylcarbamoyladenosine(37) synthase TcdA [Verrucomicrobiota bacterium]
MNDFKQRFGGIGRLLSDKGLDRLKNSHVCVIGVGGVGSWAVEALARSGIGAITLIDLDDVCVTNINRQLPALDGQIGRPKIDVLADRIALINPDCTVTAEHKFFTTSNADDILSRPFSYIIDAFDNAKLKATLIAGCRDRDIPIITAGGAGGLSDPCAIQVADLRDVNNDSLLAQLRKRLRQKHAFPRGKNKLRVPAVFSTERPVYPTGDGEVCANREDGSDDLKLNCESGFGTATYVTGAFGFAITGHVVNELAHSEAKGT